LAGFGRLGSWARKPGVQAQQGGGVKLSNTRCRLVEQQCNLLCGQFLVVIKRKDQSLALTQGKDGCRQPIPYLFILEPEEWIEFKWVGQVTQLSADRRPESTREEREAKGTYSFGALSAMPPYRVRRSSGYIPLERTNDSPKSDNKLLHYVARCGLPCAFSGHAPTLNEVLPCQSQHDRESFCYIQLRCSGVPYLGVGNHPVGCNLFHITEPSYGVADKPGTIYESILALCCAPDGQVLMATSQSEQAEQGAVLAQYVVSRVSKLYLVRHRCSQLSESIPMVASRQSAIM
jgi:hypothetical protein